MMTSRVFSHLLCCDYPPLNLFLFDSLSLRVWYIKEDLFPPGVWPYRPGLYFCGDLSTLPVFVVDTSCPWHYHAVGSWCCLALPMCVWTALLPISSLSFRFSFLSQLRNLALDFTKLQPSIKALQLLSFTSLSPADPITFPNSVKEICLGLIFLLVLRFHLLFLRTWFHHLFHFFLA